MKHHDSRQNTFDTMMLAILQNPKNTESLRPLYQQLKLCKPSGIESHSEDQQGSQVALPMDFGGLEFSGLGFWA